MKNLQNYAWKNVLCLSLLLGGCMNFIITKDKTATVTIKDKAHEASVAVKEKSQKVCEKAQETGKRVKGKAQDIVEELHEMTFADAGKALGVSAQHIRDVENIASLTREKQTKLVATLQAQVKKAEAELSKVAADAEKNKRIAVATMKKYLEQAQHELENPSRQK